MALGKRFAEVVPDALEVLPAKTFKGGSTGMYGNIAFRALKG